MRGVWIAVALSAGAVLLAGCQTPDPPSAAAAAKPQATAAAPAKPRQQASGDLQTGKICESVETTGSRFSRKECHTAAEWAQIRAQGGESLYMQDTPHSLTSNGGR